MIKYIKSKLNLYEKKGVDTVRVLRDKRFITHCNALMSMYTVFRQVVNNNTNLNSITSLKRRQCRNRNAGKVLI